MKSFLFRSASLRLLVLLIVLLLVLSLWAYLHYEGVLARIQHDVDQLESH